MASLAASPKFGMQASMPSSAGSLLAKANAVVAESERAVPERLGAVLRKAFTLATSSLHDLMADIVESAFGATSEVQPGSARTSSLAVGNERVVLMRPTKEMTITFDFILKRF